MFSENQRMQKEARKIKAMKDKYNRKVTNM
jgi:hypothetical protein